MSTCFIIKKLNLYQIHSYDIELKSYECHLVFGIAIIVSSYGIMPTHTQPAV